MRDIADELNIPKAESPICGVHIRSIELAGRAGPRIGIEICSEAHETGVQLLLHREDKGTQSPECSEELITEVEGIFFKAGPNLKPLRFYSETTFILRFDERHPSVDEVKSFGLQLGALLQSGTTIEELDQRLALFHAVNESVEE